MDKIGDTAKESEKDKKAVIDIFEKTVAFQCFNCGLSEMCQFKGKDPPFVKKLVEFKEDCFVMVDPFSPRQTKGGSNFLVLGGRCSQCDRDVCVGCSIFYTRRFCVKCATFNINEFPSDVQKRIVKLAENVASEKG